MRFSRRSLDHFVPQSLSFEFPEPERSRRSWTRAPRACLSTRASGSQRYLPGRKSPAREAFLRSLGLDPAHLIGVELFHTRRVAVEPPGGAGLPPPAEPGLPRDATRLVAEGFLLSRGDGGPDAAAGCDGIILAGGAFLPSVTVADCMPIWLYDGGTGARGVLHSGWKGTGILRVALEAMREIYGTRPEEVSCVLGPAVGSCCYRVDEGRARRFAEEFGADCVRATAAGASLDLRLANEKLAASLGLGALLSVEACTSCTPGLGSYRREGPESFTRMLALVADPAGSAEKTE